MNIVSCQQQNIFHFGLFERGENNTARLETFRLLLIVCGSYLLAPRVTYALGNLWRGEFLALATRTVDIPSSNLFSRIVSRALGFIATRFLGIERSRALCSHSTDFHPADVIHARAFLFAVPDFPYLHAPSMFLDQLLRRSHRHVKNHRLHQHTLNYRDS